MDSLRIGEYTIVLTLLIPVTYFFIYRHYGIFIIRRRYIKIGFQIIAVLIFLIFFGGCFIMFF
jgi:hypothetical protein